AFPSPNTLESKNDRWKELFEVQFSRACCPVPPIRDGSHPPKLNFTQQNVSRRAHFACQKPPPKTRPERTNMKSMKSGNLNQTDAVSATIATPSEEPTS